MGASRVRQQLLLLGALGWCCCSGAAAAAAAGEWSEGSVERAAESLGETGEESAAAAAATTGPERQLQQLLDGFVDDGLLRVLGAPAAAAPAAPAPLEVPDWNEGLNDSPQQSNTSSSSSSNTRPRVHFTGPFPPSRSWVPVYFSNYGRQYPMGPLLLSCLPQPGGRAACDVVPNTPYSPVNPKP